MSIQPMETRMAHLEGAFEQVGGRLNSIERRLDWLIGIVVGTWITTRVRSRLQSDARRHTGATVLLQCRLGRAQAGLAGGLAPSSSSTQISLYRSPRSIPIANGFAFARGAFRGLLCVWTLLCLFTGRSPFIAPRVRHGCFVRSLLGGRPSHAS